jgi:hypothetical protein
MMDDGLKRFRAKRTPFLGENASGKTRRPQETQTYQALFDSGGD